MSLGILCAAALSHTTNAFGGCPVSVGSTRSAKMSMSRFRHAPALAQAPTRWGVRASTLLALRMSDEQVSSWDSAKVGAWLEKEGFNADWQKAFSDNEIDGEALKLLKDPSVLDDMQIPKQVGARLKFWQKLDLILPPDERGTTTLSVAAVQAPEEQFAAPAVAAASSFSSPGTMTGTQTLVAPVSVDEAAKVAGTSLSAPLDGMSLESLMADEAKFVDGMCQLLADLDAKERDVTLLLDMKDRLNNLFSVVIVGEFNAGKSSLINAILGSRFCQEGVVPTTTTINMLRYGEGEESGQIQRNKDYLELFLPVPLLKQVVLVDTPGTNAIIKEQTRLTKGFIPQSDLVIFVTSAERPVTETEGKLLDYIREWGKKVVMVLNKVDLFEDEESQVKVVDFVKENCARILGSEPPVFGIAGRLALNSKLKRAAGDIAAADELWERSQFQQLESYIVNQLTDKKEAAKLKLESPLGVAERFLENYKQAASLGGKITEDDKIVLTEIKDSIEAYEKSVLEALKQKLDKLETILDSVQQKASATSAKVLSGQYIASNIVGVLSKSASIEGELKMAMDIDLDKELKALAEDFGRTLKDKQDAQWNLCSALITQRLNNRGWKQIKLTKPDLTKQVDTLIQSVAADAERSKRNARFDPQVETMVLGQSVAAKAFDIAVATVAVAGGGLLALEVFNAGILDALAFVGTTGGLGYTLGIYPSMMQDQVKLDLDNRADAWKGDLRDEMRELFKDAAVQSNFEMEQALGPYVDAVSVEASKWASVSTRVNQLSNDLSTLRSRINNL